MSANIHELLFALGVRQQTDLVTANIAADMICLPTATSDAGDITPITEDDAKDFGKGHAFATTQFVNAWDAQFQPTYFLSSEILAIALAFCLGKAAKATAGSGFAYTCTPLDPVADGIDMPSLTVGQQIRPGVSAYLDRAALGVVVDEFSVTIRRGPGRANSQIRLSLVGTGLKAEPSGITFPALSTPHLLPSSGLSLTIIGTNEVSLKVIEELTFGWRNNVRKESGFYPGSGFQTSGDASSGAVRGRMEQGDPEPFLSFTVRLRAGAPEYAQLSALTTGTAVIGLTGPNVGSVAHGATITYQKVAFKAISLGDADGIATLRIDCSVQKHASNGVVTAVVTTGVNHILELPA